MMLRVAINGFGRIGRLVFRAIVENHRDGIQVVAINDLADIESNAYLLRYDSVHGRFHYDVKTSPTGIDVGFGETKVLAQADPEKLPWKDRSEEHTYELQSLMRNSYAVF